MVVYKLFGKYTYVPISSIEEETQEEQIPQ